MKETTLNKFDADFNDELNEEQPTLSNEEKNNDFRSINESDKNDLDNEINKIFNN